MNIEESKKCLPPGWNSLADRLFVAMDEHGVPYEKLIEVSVIGGYAVFFFGLMSLGMFDAIRDTVYFLEVRSKTMCCICGARTRFMRLGMAMCDSHQKEIENG